MKSRIKCLIKWLIKGRILLRRALPLRSRGQVPPCPQAKRLGLKRVQVHGGHAGFQRQPLVKPAPLPTRLPATDRAALAVYVAIRFTPGTSLRIASPLLRVLAARLGAPCPRLTWPIPRLVIAAGINKACKGDGSNGRAVNFKIGQVHHAAGALVVKSETRRAGRYPDLNLPAAHGNGPTIQRLRHLRHGKASRRWVTQGGAQPAQRLAVHIFVEQRQAVRVQGGIVRD